MKTTYKTPQEECDALKQALKEKTTSCDRVDNYRRILSKCFQCFLLLLILALLIFYLKSPTSIEKLIIIRAGSLSLNLRYLFFPILLGPFFIWFFWDLILSYKRKKAEGEVKKAQKAYDDFITTLHQEFKGMLDEKQTGVFSMLEEYYEMNDKEE